MTNPRNRVVVKTSSPGGYCPWLDMWSALHNVLDAVRGDVQTFGDFSNRHQLGNRIYGHDYQLRRGLR